MDKPIFIFVDEPTHHVVGKWLGWVVVIAIFVILFIYLSKKNVNESFAADYTGIPSHDIRNAKWRRRFAETYQ